MADYRLNEWMNESMNQSISVYTGRVPTDLTLTIEPNSGRNRILKYYNHKIFKAENSYICKDL